MKKLLAMVMCVCLAAMFTACGKSKDQTDSEYVKEHFADQVQLRAGNDSASLIHNADHPIDCVLHLVDHALKYSIGDRKSTRLNSSHVRTSRMPSSA